VEDQGLDAGRGGTPAHPGGHSGWLVVSGPFACELVSRITEFLTSYGIDVTALDFDFTDHDRSQLRIQATISRAGLADMLPAIRRAFGETIAPLYGVVFHFISDSTRAAVTVRATSRTASPRLPRRGKPGPPGQRR
jgi:hypothetical protein